MKINEAAKRLRMTPRAIRLYEKEGLLEPGRERGNGYRTYTGEDLRRLQTIASLREIGLSLQAIKLILDRLDRKDTEGIHHGLEAQRMTMMAEWSALTHSISAMDECIRRLEARQDFHAEDLFELAEELKQRRLLSAWEDRWSFDRLAVEYDHSAALYAAGPEVSEREYAAVLDIIEQWVAPRPEETGLDIGAGTGNIAGRLSAKGMEMYAVDQSKEMLRRCREKFPEVRSKLGNALALPFLDKQFHCVVSAFALHHLNEAQLPLALEEIHRVLQPNGRICLAGLMRSVHPGDSAAADSRHPIDRGQLLDWLREHDYITIQQQVSASLHVVYGVRRG